MTAPAPGRPPTFADIRARLARVLGALADMESAHDDEAAAVDVGGGPGEAVADA